MEVSDERGSSTRLGKIHTDDRGGVRLLQHRRNKITPDNFRESQCRFYFDEWHKNSDQAEIIRKNN